MKTRIRRWFRPLSDHRPADRRGLLAAAGLFLLLECFAVSCRKDPSDFATEKNPLRFSTDTVFFDTILSTLNVPVARFTITNPGKKPVKIDRIHIRPGESGYGQESFRFTVNGDTSSEIRDLVLYGRDSLFVFVRSGIRLSPSGQNGPFIVDAYFQCDIAESQSSQSVYLYAYGQDAHYWHADRVHARPYTDARQPGVVDTQHIPYFIWSPETHPIVPGDKPYAIFGYLTVPEGQTLEIPAGARLHFGTNAGIWVQKGARLRVNGEINAPVLFSGLRLDTLYKNETGQWGQIWLDAESGDHFIRNAVIQNGTTGIWLDSVATLDAIAALTIENTVIKNMSNYGLMARGTQVEGVNLVVGHCGKGISLRRGGTYRFTHCTLTNYGSQHSDAYSVEIDEERASGATQAFSNCRFTNCIFDGSYSNQIFCNMETAPDETALCFDHCLIKQFHFEGLNQTLNVCQYNLDPLFRLRYDSRRKESDFHIDTTASPAYAKGLPAAVSGAATADITGFIRPTVPTLGAYEYRPADDLPPR